MANFEVLETYNSEIENWSQQHRDMLMFSTLFSATHK